GADRQRRAAHLERARGAVLGYAQQLHRAFFGALAGEGARTGRRHGQVGDLPGVAVALALGARAPSRPHRPEGDGGGRRQARGRAGAAPRANFTASEVAMTPPTSAAMRIAVSRPSAGAPARSASTYWLRRSAPMAA